METDEQLVEKTLAGDKTAYEKLVRKYQDMVYGLAFHFTKNFADAQDIAQEAFIKAYLNLSSLRQRNKFAGWIRTITANISKSMLGGQNAKVMLFSEMSDEQMPTEIIQIAGRNPTPEQNLERQELHETLIHAIQRLSENQQSALTLFYLNGMSYQEVADFLEVSQAAVKSRLQRARDNLKEELSSMVEQTFQQNKLKPDFSKDIIHFLQEHQGKIIQEWAEDMAVIDDAISKKMHESAISAFLSSLIELFKDDSEAEEYYEFVETLAQEYNMEHLSPKEVAEMMFLLQGIMFTNVLRNYSDEKMEAFQIIQDKVCKVAHSSLAKEGGWVRAAAGRFTIEETPSAIRWAKDSWGTVGGSYGSRKQPQKKNKFPGYMICYYANHPADLIQKPVSVGKLWTEGDSDDFHQKGYAWKVTVESMSETACTPAGCFSNCLKLKTVIMGDGVDKDGKRTPEIDVFVRGTRLIWFAPGVGLVKLEYHHEEGSTTEVNLISYSVGKANNSYLPLALGNIWRYQWTNTHFDYANEEVWRVTAKDEDKYRISCFNRMV